MVVYDNGVARANPLCGFIQIGCTGGLFGALYDSIQWSADASTLYAANNEDTGFDFYTIPVSSNGFGTAKDYNGVISGFGVRIHYDAVTGDVYDDGGRVIDPSNASVLGTFTAGGLMVPDGTLGKAFILGQSRSQFGSSTYTIQSFDIRRFTPISTLTLTGVTGQPSHLVRWGSNGLAFTTEPSPVDENGNDVGQVYILSGDFVDGPVPSSSAAEANSEDNVHRSWPAPRIHRAAPSH